MSASIGRRSMLWICVAIPALVLAFRPLSAQQHFRASTDVILVDVQVVDRSGTPLASLRTEHFEIFIDGRRRSIVDLQFLNFDATAADGSGQSERAAQPPGQPTARTFWVAVDQASFPVQGQYAAREAAMALIRRARASDLIGLVAYPGGTAVAPTLDRKPLIEAVGRLHGMRVDFGARRYNISPTDAVHLKSRSFETSAIIGRECGKDPYNPTCPREVVQEGQALADALEQQALLSIDGLHGVIDGIQELDGRKTVIVVSAGMPMSNLPGGRPDLDGEVQRLARRAASVNVNLYVFYMNIHFMQAYSAAGRRITHSIFDDVSVFGLGLEKFADAAGGAFSQVEVDPTPFVDRVFRETSATYVVAVAAQPSDYDGREHFVRVAVKEPGATVRHRRVVVIPPRPPRF